MRTYTRKDVTEAYNRGREDERNTHAHLSELSGMTCSPAIGCPIEEFRKFHATLRPGERVIELGESGMKGQTGTVVDSKMGKCVKWDTKFKEGQITTSVTEGTRRIF